MALLTPLDHPLHRFVKRLFDAAVAFVGTMVLLIPAILVACAVRLSSKGSVLFRQQRVGRGGRLFWCVKFRTMRINDGANTVTTANDSRITPVGRFLRASKLDELPQLFNVLTGDMSFVGPRPDVPGYADTLQGDDRMVLALRSGITGPASIFFRDEEAILARVPDPHGFNDAVIWPAKVAINRIYLQEWSFFRDIAYILVTIIPRLDALLHVMQRFDCFRDLRAEDRQNETEQGSPDCTHELTDRKCGIP